MKESNLSPLQKTVQTTATDYWNDSCSIEELTYAIRHGAVGATTNPVIVKNVLQQEMHLWSNRIREIIKANPDWSELEVTWRVIEEVALKGAKMLEPIFSREEGAKGRLSLQTNPTYYRNSDAMVNQAVYFSTLAPNIQVKIPATRAGIAAIEEATFQGVNINATVCFTVPQAVAVAEAVERGLNRRESLGLCIDDMTPVCTIMIGRTDDWIQVQAKRDAVIANPTYVHWAGVATIKKAYEIFQEKGYRARLLAAAFRHHLHWSELIGGDLILTIPYNWQLLFNASDIEVVERMQTPVDPAIIDELRNKFSDFRRAFDVDGMSVEEFDSYGATVRTLRSFISGYYELISMVREFMLPNPDIRA
jgi:transaldolase